MNPRAVMTLQSVNAVLRSRKLYPAGHPAIAASFKKAYTALADYLKNRENVLMGFSDETFIFDDLPVIDGQRQYRELLKTLSDKKVESVVVERGFTEAEFTSAVEALASEDIGPSDIERALFERGVRRIILKPMHSAYQDPVEIYDGAVELVKNVVGEVRLGKIPRSGAIKNIVTKMTDTVLSDPNAMLGLTMIKDYDNYLYTHCVNVAVLSLALARTMGLSDDDLHSIGLGALLHDIGKIAISEEIINKAGALTPEEWDKIKAHPEMGANIAMRMEGLGEAAVCIIHEHHMKFDLSGYPRFTGRLNPLSQLVSIADSYDALTTVRVYQRPYQPIEAVKVMKGLSGRHFDPAMLDMFFKAVGLYPVGTVVRLSTNEVGVVIRINPERTDAPTVKVVLDPDGKTLPAAFEIDLSARADSPVAIIGPADPLKENIDVTRFLEGELRQAG